LEDSSQPQHAGIDVWQRRQLVLRLPNPKWRALRLQTRARDQGRPDHQDAFAITGNANFVPTEGTATARVRLFLQQQGDTLTAQEPYKRWWSVPYAELREGESTLTVAVSPDQWSSVFGQGGAEVPNEFNAAISKLGNVGFTFGGTFAGHGVFVTGGNARFVLKEFSVSP
jgi:hypothetical protein